MPDKFSAFVLPPAMPVTEELSDRALKTVQTYGNWLLYAMDLLEPGVLDTTSAHNKVKHGLAVRGRADLRTTLSLGGPNADGDIELSSLTGEQAVDVFARPVLEFLSRPGKMKKEGQREGLELTQLELNYRVILADAVMLALVHGALLHVAAYWHFHGRELPTGLTVAPHPGFVGSLPEPHHTGHQVGMRFPITAPEHGGPTRPSVITWRDGTYQTLKFTGEAVKNVRVVDSSMGASGPDAGTDG